MHERITTAFMSFAATELTNNGLTGPKPIEITSAYAADFCKDIPHARYSFDAPNKRTAPLDNLLFFEPKQQYQIIRELSHRFNLDGSVNSLTALKVKLFNEFSRFADEDNLTDINNILIIETRHWLSDFPEVKKSFEEALQKHDHVIRLLNYIIEWRIRCDNGPEYISHLLANWAIRNKIELKFIQPGNPQQNAYIERFNRTVRYDWLAQDIFTELEDRQERADKWLWTYNNLRPDMGIGGITPAQKRQQLNLNSTANLR